MPKSRAVPGELRTGKGKKPLGSGLSCSQKRRAEPAERFGPGSETVKVNGLEFVGTSSPELKKQPSPVWQQEQEEEDPRNRVEPATSSSQAGNWWEDPRNRAASSSWEEWQKWE